MGNPNGEGSRHLEIAYGDFTFEGYLPDDTVHGGHCGIALKIIHFAFEVVCHANVGGLAGFP
ncbi:hypothetical protein D3C85_1753080 [compost metagenome]